VKSARRRCGTATVGVDKGYSEVLVDTDGDHHGPELGELLRQRCDTLKERNTRRATLRSIANQAAGRGRHGTAERIRRTNLGTITKHRQRRRWEQQVATVTYRAVNAVVDNARVQNTAGVESETSNPDQHRSRNRKQSDESNAR
jgi:siroheme synthase (precorrin-2 oxidase/ferrochelatase)